MEKGERKEEMENNPQPEGESTNANRNIYRCIGHEGHENNPIYANRNKFNAMASFSSSFASRSRKNSLNLPGLSRHY